MKLMSMLLVVAVLIAGLVGCGGTQTAPGSENTASTVTSEKTENDVTVKPEETKKLDFWDFTWGPSEYTNVAKGLVEEYNNSNDLNVEFSYQSVSWQSGYETFITAISAGDPPDVSTGGGFSQHQYAAMGEILPLDSIVADWEADGSINDFFPGLFDNFKYKGEQIGIPWNIDSRVIYYRKDIFKEAGIDKLPTTWDELIEVGKQLSNDEHCAFIFSLQDNSSDHPMQVLMASNGCGYLDSEGKPNFDSDKHVEILDFVENMVKEGVIPETVVSTTRTDVERMFFNGETAMILVSSDLPDIAISEMGKEWAEENLGILPPLKGASGGGFSAMNPNAIMAFNKTPYPEESKEFIKWFSKNNIELWTKGGCGPFPARASFFEADEYFSNQYKQFFKNVVFSNAVTQTYPYPSATPSMNAIESGGFLRMVLQEALTTDRDHKEILSDVNEELKGFVEEMDK